MTDVSEAIVTQYQSDGSDSLLSDQPNNMRPKSC